MQNDDHDSDTAYVSDDWNTNQTVQQALDSDEIDYHPSNRVVRVGPGDVDDEQDRKMSLLQMTNLRKAIGIRKSQQIFGRLP